MRVLHLYAGNLYGGIERLLVTLARERGRCAEMRPHFGLCFDGPAARDLRAEGVGVDLLGDVRFSRPWTVWRARRRLGGLLRRERFDAVVCHACWPHAVFAPAVRAAGIPLVFWTHDVPAGTHWLERLAARTPPDRAIANSRFTQAGLPRLFPRVPSGVVYCPVPPPPAIPDRDRDRQEVRSELETGPEDVVVVMASRLEPWKGHRLLLAALGRLNGVAGWTCWIAGGPQRPHEAAYLDGLAAEARRLGIGARVRFLGQRSDVHRLLAAADIHCQPNTGPESFGIAFIEALAAGLPVVTTRLGAAPEIVTDECGCLVAPDGAESLATALHRLVADPAARAGLSGAGPARARSLCDPAVQIPLLRGFLSGAGVTSGAAA